MTLLARSTRSVNLTNDGRDFLKFCQLILEQVENLDNFLHQKNEIGGNLRIAIPPYFSRYHIVPFLDEFLSIYPNLKLDISLTENPVNIIDKGLDLQIRIQIPEEENLKVEKLMTNKKVICAAPKYLKKYGIPKEPNDLLKHNCIIFGENKIWRLRSNKTKKVINLHKLSGNISCDNGEIIKELILSGLGIAIKSERDIEEEIKTGRIKVLLSDYEIIDSTYFYAVYAEKKYQSPKIRAFVDFFREKLGK